MKTDEQIRRALDSLAAEPVPDGLARRAWAGAIRRKRLRASATFGAAATAVAVSLPFAGLLAGGDPAVRPGGTGVPGTAVDAPCQVVTGDADATRWPEFVGLALATLPDRWDYRLHAASTWCSVGEGMVGAAADFELVSGWRLAGNLRLELAIADPAHPADCADVQRGVDDAPDEIEMTLLLCEEATGTAPMTYATATGPSGIRGEAQYADGRYVTISAYGQEPPLTAEEVRAAVRDPRLHSVIPEPGPEHARPEPTEPR